jgi:hypothetical protein
MMALRPAIAKKQKDEKLPLAIILIHFNCYLGGGVCAILIGQLDIRRATDKIYITSANPSRDLSWSPPTYCAWPMAEVPRLYAGYERSPERQAVRKWRHSYSFLSSLRCMDRALYLSFLPQEIILPFDEVLGMTMIVVFILAENRSSRGDSCRSIITRQSALYNRGHGLILLDNNRSFPRQSASSSKEIRKGGPGLATNNPISSSTLCSSRIRHRLGTYWIIRHVVRMEVRTKKKSEGEGEVNVDLKVKLGINRTRVCACGHVQGQMGRVLQAQKRG